MKKRWNLQRSVLSSFLKEYFHNSDKVKILEAGCGKKWNLNLEGIDYELTGVDISKEALEIRKYQQQDLDIIITGDLRTIELNNAKYDVVYCSNVLEHINGAEKVLDKLFRWIKPNGFLLLLTPDKDTVFGFIYFIINISKKIQMQVSLATVLFRHITTKLYLGAEYIITARVMAIKFI